MILRQTEQAIRDTLQQSFLDNTTTGVLGISGGISLNNNKLALATGIVEWDTPKTTSVHTGDFSTIATNVDVILWQPTDFIMDGLTPDLFKISGFTFSQTKSEIVSQSEQRVELLWTGTTAKTGVATKATVVKVVITAPATIGGANIVSLQTLSQPTLLPIPILISDQADVKPPMPYILVKCEDAEELITPESGVFKTTATICLKTHAKYTDSNLKTSPAYREQVIDLIDQFSYNNTATVLSTVANYHCHGWEQKERTMETDNDQKSLSYFFNYDVTCMSLDN